MKKTLLIVVLTIITTTFFVSCASSRVNHSRGCQETRDFVGYN
jgi:hypothetical protein